MSRYQKILVFADPAMTRGPAFERGVALAQSSGGKLHIVLIDHSRLIEVANRLGRHEASQAQQAWIQQRRQWLEAEAEVLRGKGLDVTVDAVWSHSPRAEMVTYANELGADLIVKEVRHEPLAKRIWLTPLDWHLVRECKAPVMLVGIPTHKLPRRIVVAINVYSISGSDDDQFNQQVVKEALDLAIQCNAELHLASSVDFPMIQGDGLAMVGSWAPELYDDLHRNHAEALRAYADAHRIPPDRVHSLAGWTPLALSTFAEGLGADVIVVGTHARHGLDRLLMGSVAEAVIDAGPCDVLVVKQHA